MTKQLGNALALLAKHGLNKAREKDFPVEVAMETLLSPTPLLVSAAVDSGLTRCERLQSSRPHDCSFDIAFVTFPITSALTSISAIQYFEDRCVDENGKIASRFVDMPIGRMLRGGTTQHKLTASDLRKLRKTTRKCIEVYVYVGIWH